MSTANFLIPNFLNSLTRKDIIFFAKPTLICCSVLFESCMALPMPFETRRFRGNSFWIIYSDLEIVNHSWYLLTRSQAPCLLFCATQVLWGTSLAPSLGQFWLVEALELFSFCQSSWPWSLQTHNITDLKRLISDLFDALTLDQNEWQMNAMYVSNTWIGKHWTSYQVWKIPCVVWCCKLVVQPPHRQLFVHSHCQMVEAPRLIFKHYQSMDVPYLLLFLHQRWGCRCRGLTTWM